MGRPAATTMLAVLAVLSPWCPPAARQLPASCCHCCRRPRIASSSSPSSSATRRPYGRRAPCHAAGPILRSHVSAPRPQISQMRALPLRAPSRRLRLDFSRRASPLWSAMLTHQSVNGLAMPLSLRRSGAAAPVRGIPSSLDTSSTAIDCSAGQALEVLVLIFPCPFSIFPFPVPGATSPDRVGSAPSMIPHVCPALAVARDEPSFRLPHDALPLPASSFASDWCASR